MNMNKSVLYYPNIEIGDDAFLKSSLLLWDEVYRIVPSTYIPSDSRQVRIAADNGLLNAITLESADFLAISSEFKKFLKKLPFRPAGLDGSRTDRLHKEKIDSQLYPALESLASNVDPEGFLELPSDLSRGYMMYLAKAVSGRRNLATITDDRYAWTISPYYRERANFGEKLYDLEAPALHASLIFADLLPAHIENIDMKDIVKFIEKRKDERENMRTTLIQFANELSSCQSPSHVLQLRSKFIKQLDRAKKDFKSSMDFLNEDDTHALFTFGIPVSATIFGALGLAGDPFDILKISASLFIGGIAAYADYRKVKFANRRESDISYLVDLDKEFLNRNAIPRYDRIFEEFVND